MANKNGHLFSSLDIKDDFFDIIYFLGRLLSVPVHGEKWSLFCRTTNRTTIQHFTHK
mgnify:CR=1 FL=1